MPRSLPRFTSFLWISVAYVAALAVAFAVVRALGPAAHPLWAAALADAVATIVVFVFSRALDNTSVYDPYWSVAPIAVASYFATHPEAASAQPVRQALIITLVTLWGIRLTYNWAVGFSGLGHEDWRYADMRKKTGRAYWVTSFLGLHFFPTAIVYAGLLPLYPALTSSAPLGPMDALAAFVTLAAVGIETIADEQLRAFRKRRKSSAEIMNTGLWEYSRHPNYFGEALFWWGLFLFARAAKGPLWTVSGAAAITLMFVFVSIPMIDKRSIERRPEYREHMRRVSALVPWFRARPGD